MTRPLIQKLKPAKSDRKAKKASEFKPVTPKRKDLEKQLEAMVKLIIFWRDGLECVQKEQDGIRCGGNGLGWGHYIAQKQSDWLRYDLGNVFVQCSSHNKLDYHGDKTYGLWFDQTFGVYAAEAMN